MRPETEVTVIGLGNMGAALAQAFLDHGHTLTVWNRSPDKAARFAAAGAKVAESAAAAIAASPITVMCVLDYPAAKSILAGADIGAAIAGRTLVQLSTGNAGEAREQAAWAQVRGVQYLDGGIMCYPRDVGRPDTAILYSGAPAAMRAHASTLSSLAGAQRHVGSDPGAANTVYLALWTFYFSAHGAFMEGAALAASAAMPVLEFSSLAAPMLAKLAADTRLAAQQLTDGDLIAKEASIDLMLAGVDSVTNAFASVRVPCEIANAYFDYLVRAREMGFGAMDIACVFDVLAADAGFAGRVAVSG